MDYDGNKYWCQSSSVCQVTPDFLFTPKIINYFTFSENTQGCLFIENLDDYHICSICHWDSDCQNDTNAELSIQILSFLYKSLMTTIRTLDVSVH